MGRHLRRFLKHVQYVVSAMGYMGRCLLDTVQQRCSEVERKVQLDWCEAPETLPQTCAISIFSHGLHGQVPFEQCTAVVL